MDEKKCIQLLRQFLKEENLWERFRYNRYKYRGIETPLVGMYPCNYIISAFPWYDQSALWVDVDTKWRNYYMQNK